MSGLGQILDRRPLDSELRRSSNCFCVQWRAAGVAWCARVPEKSLCTLDAIVNTVVAPGVHVSVCMWCVVELQV